jgi:hypothetical protein
MIDNPAAKERDMNQQEAKDICDHLKVGRTVRLDKIDGTYILTKGQTPPTPDPNWPVVKLAMLREGDDEFRVEYQPGTARSVNGRSVEEFDATFDVTPDRRNIAHEAIRMHLNRE